MSIINKLQNLKTQDPNTFDLLQQLAKNARNSNLDPIVRLRCAAALGDIGGNLIMDSLREEALKMKDEEPRYEYRFVRGARVKVRVN